LPATRASNPGKGPRLKSEAADAAFEFSAVFEVYPEIKLGDLASIAIERPQVEVTQADIDRTLDVLRKQRAVFEPVTRGAQTGDRALVDFTGTIDGAEFPGGQPRTLRSRWASRACCRNSKRRCWEPLPAIPGTFPLTFPADYHGKEVAGKTAQFALTVKQVTAPVIPPLDSAFATAFGIKSGNVDDLRAEVEANLKLELKRKLEATLKEQALKGLRQTSELTLPKSLVEQEALQLARRMAANLQQQGMKPEDIKLSPEMFRPQAEERVALGTDPGRDRARQASRSQAGTGPCDGAGRRADL
jgi:trigger factor